ncbi:MAG: MBL fold metallo-hydrolase [Desulfurococcales archaeon]|nr:MBL fold metallo-hydrolase [Desulfurococcales archaeon]
MQRWTKLENQGIPELKIEQNGAIVVGPLAIDGCAYKPVRIVTHAHQDHIVSLSKSYKNSGFVVATPETFAILRGLGLRVNSTKSLELKYDIPVTMYDAKFVFRKMNHIPGTAGVEVDLGGKRIAYTSDFRLEDSHIFENVDVLIIDATYGHPSYKRTWSRMHIVNKILHLIEEHDKNLWVYGYYGKAQGFMLLLREAGYREPIVLTRKMYGITAELESVGLSFGKYLQYESRESEELVKSNHSIIIDHAINFKHRKKRPGIHVLLTGWATKPVEILNEWHYRMSYSDHADYYDILEYVRLARPKTVIVDASRSSYARFMARAIENTLGIHALAMP